MSVCIGASPPRGPAPLVNRSLNLSHSQGSGIIVHPSGWNPVLCLPLKSDRTCGEHSLVQMLQILSMGRFGTQLEALCPGTKDRAIRHLGRLPEPEAQFLEVSHHLTPPPVVERVWLCLCLEGQAGSRMNEWMMSGHQRGCSSLDQCHTWAALSTSLLNGGWKIRSRVVVVRGQFEK